MLSCGCTAAGDISVRRAGALIRMPIVVVPYRFTSLQVSNLCCTSIVLSGGRNSLPGNALRPARSGLPDLRAVLHGAYYAGCMPAARPPIAGTHRLRDHVRQRGGVRQSGFPAVFFPRSSPPAVDGDQSDAGPAWLATWVRFLRKVARIDPKASAPCSDSERTFRDPLADAKTAERWLASFPPTDPLAIQRDVLAELGRLTERSANRTPQGLEAVFHVDSAHRGAAPDAHRRSTSSTRRARRASRRRSGSRCSTSRRDS